MRRLIWLALPSVFAASVACSDTQGPIATFVLDTTTITLYSLRTGPLTLPDAFSLNAGRGVAVWQVGTNFEFAFWMDSTGKASFLPLDVLGLSATGSVKPGLLKTATPFDAMTQAPQNGYITSDTITVAEGETFYVRSGVSACASFGVPLYGKLQILDIDTTAASITMLTLSDQNCGFRGLVPGELPKN
jgi:hypothetical protein